MSMAFACTAGAQTVDYLYGIEYGTGSGQSNATWNLDQMAINVNVSGVATSYTQTTLTNLTQYISNWDSTGNTNQNQCINALALDPATNTLFFTYTYNNNSNASNGTFFAQSYALRWNGSGFTATEIYTYSETTRTVGTAGVIGSGGVAGSSNVGAGWFTKGMFYNGSYYVGIQTNPSNNLVQLTLAANENSVTSATVYTGINHNGADASQGGDFVISSSGQLYVSGRTAGGGGSTFATETLANALSTSGTAWNAATNAGGSTYYYQMAGLGQIPRLYGFSSGGSLQLGQFTNFTNPSGTLVWTAISGTSPVIFSDMSDGSNHSIITPEPGTMGAGVLGSVAVVGVFLRRKKRPGAEPVA